MREEVRGPKPVKRELQRKPIILLIVLKCMMQSGITLMEICRFEGTIDRTSSFTFAPTSSEVSTGPLSRSSCKSTKGQLLVLTILFRDNRLGFNIRSRPPRFRNRLLYSLSGVVFIAKHIQPKHEGDRDRDRNIPPPVFTNCELGRAIFARLCVEEAHPKD